MEGVVEAHVVSGEFVDDVRVEFIAPKFGEPAADYGLVFLESQVQWVNVIGVYLPGDDLKTWPLTEV